MNTVDKAKELIRLREAVGADEKPFVDIRMTSSPKGYDFAKFAVIESDEIAQDYLRLQAENGLLRGFCSMSKAFEAENEKLRVALEVYKDLSWSVEYYYKEKDQYCYNVVAPKTVETAAKEALNQNRGDV